MHDQKLLFFVDILHEPIHKESVQIKELRKKARVLGVGMPQP